MSAEENKPQGGARRGLRLRGVFACLVLIVMAVAIYAWRDYSRFADAALAPLAVAIAIDVPLGTPLSGVLRELERGGVQTGQSLYWRLLARQMGVGGRLHAGEYALAPGITPRQLLAKMAAGVADDLATTLLLATDKRVLAVPAMNVTGCPSTPSSTGATGFREYFSSGPFFGRPKWLIRITLRAPASSSARMVGRLAVTRVSSCTTPPLIGTL